MVAKLDEMANIKGLPSVIEGSTNERYSGIEDVKNMQAEFIRNGTVSESMCDVIMDICNRFGAGEFQNAQEAMEAFKEQEYKEQEETHWESLLYNLHILMMMFCLERTGIMRILM